MQLKLGKGLYDPGSIEKKPLCLGATVITLGLAGYNFSSHSSYVSRETQKRVSLRFNLKSESKKRDMFKHWPLVKKSSIFVVFSWNFVKMISSWVDYFHQLSWG